MTFVFIILICAAVALGIAGGIMLSSVKGHPATDRSAQMVSPDAMVRVSPAGPGKLRMSFPQGDRMPVEVMLQITEITEETDLDRLKDPSRTPEEKQEVVNRLRSLGYEIAYDPLPEAVPQGPADEEFQYAVISEPPSEDLPDHGEGEVDPVTLRSLPEEPSPLPEDGYTDFLEDVAAITPPDADADEQAPVPPEEEKTVSDAPTAEDERLRLVADSEGLGGIQLLEPGITAEEGHDGRKAIALMEYLSAALRDGRVEPRVVMYAEELLNIQVKDAPWREGREARLRPESEFRPLDVSVMEMDLDEFDIYVRSQASTENRPARKSVRHGGKRLPAWDRLDMD